ncbi:30S ribosomal protein S4 [candidate division MSBL1 archaeon SCGC-AAA259E17]|uniref:Small ribosomal subunit protein uS4 n=1 Tax=candidate division MSBL1 archaeon SCGC-AAA259E17 TaxID=1698263 RepID=A0A133UGT6_9EURY|nr:30S ribosomal protein S4 [candidate division MSBL1 archaeon SCGC-AAA259E17]
MGDPKRQKKQYAAPLRPWDRERISEEASLMNNYGLKSKEEVWRTETRLRNFRREARKLMAASGKQADKEARQLLNKLRNLGLVDEESSVVDVLRLDIEDVLDRRLQSVVFEKGLARTPSQARQMIVHGHILIRDKCVTEPGYLVSVEEEEELSHRPGSPFEGKVEPAEPVEEE